MKYLIIKNDKGKMPNSKKHMVISLSQKSQSIGTSSQTRSAETVRKEVIKPMSVNNKLDSCFPCCEAIQVSEDF